MVLQGFLRDVHVFAFIDHKCGPALSVGEWRKGCERRRREKEGIQKRKKIKQRKKRKPSNTAFCIPFLCFSKYYLIPMMELTERNRDSLVPPKKTNQCIFGTSGPYLSNMTPAPLAASGHQNPINFPPKCLRGCH